MQLIVNENYELKSLNTFGIEARAAWLARASRPDEVAEAAAFARSRCLPLKVLGGGSNILLTGDQQALILKMEIAGVSIVADDSDEVLIAAGAGCDWESLIDFAVERNLWGIENLTLIPGKVGSSPIQNIGAYGVELKDVFHSLTAYDLQSRAFVELPPAACHFGYRDSLFKSEGFGRYIITRVIIRLSRRPNPRLTYGNLAEAFQKEGITNPSPADIVEAIRAIRRRKLPDTAEVGSAGSFFQNPLIDNEIAKDIQSRYPQAPLFSVDASRSKIAAGWLIEQCGWKGFRDGDAGVWPQQALVLVNYGKASGSELAGLAHRIIESVKEKFSITLRPEVNFW